jgi:hypothetical protein
MTGDKTKKKLLESCDLPSLFWVDCEALSKKEIER